MTASADEACSAADLIIITAPSHVRESVLHSIAPALPRHKQVFVGAIPGFGGFDWMAEKAFGGLSNIVIWGMKDVPILRLILYRKSVRMGAKSQLYVAVHCRETPENTDILLDYLKQLYEAPVTLLLNTEITLTPEIQSCTAPSFMVSSVHGGSGTGMLSIIFRVGGVTARNSVLISSLAVMRKIRPYVKLPNFHWVSISALCSHCSRK